MTDPLARLRAGLDEEARIARAAAERAAEWRSDGKGVSGGPFTPADPEWSIAEDGAHTIVYDEGWPLEPEAFHIARQDPAATLARVEAIRKVITAYTAAVARDEERERELEAEGLMTNGLDSDSMASGAEIYAYARVLEILASIYPEES